MPELPEVETIRRGLLKCIRGLKVAEIKVFCEKSFIGSAEAIVGAKVLGLRRFGKALVIDFNNEMSMICHLRMTGQLIYRGEEDFAGGHPNDNFIAELPNKQTRVEIDFEDSGKLFFNDQRKFGFMKVVQTEKVLEDKFIASLAPEPWQMTGEELFDRLQRHKNALIKAVILDQKVISGLGNIYADEALFFAKIHPARRAGTISRAEAKTLIEGARTVMERSLESGGSTIATYVKADGTKGDYLELFAEVFNRQGEQCKRCGTEICKIRVAGRGTHICPKCQKEKI